MGAAPSMVVAQSRQLLLYTLWADRACLRAVAAVRAEDLTRDAGASFGSLLGTLAHVLGSERLWLSRFSGLPLDRVADLSDFPDLATLSAAWEETAAELESFLASLDEPQLLSPLAYVSTEGESLAFPLWQLVLNLANHSTYHRGQVVSLLRQLGYEPPSTDLITFFVDHPPPPIPPT